MLLVTVACLPVLRTRVWTDRDQLWIRGPFRTHRENSTLGRNRSDRPNATDGILRQLQAWLEAGPA